MVLDQLIHVRLGLNQELGLGQGGKAGAQGRGALVSGAWSSSGVGVAKEDVPRLGKGEEVRGQGQYPRLKHLLA